MREKRRAGRPPAPDPERRTAVLNASIETGQLNRLRSRAIERNISVSRLLREILAREGCQP